MFSRDELAAIADVVKDFPRLWVISDEVYKYIVHSPPPQKRGDGKLASGGHVHFARLPGMWDRTLTVSSAGKTFSVTGWQVGWIVGPATLVRDIQTLLPYVQFCAATPSQEALTRVLRKADQPYEGAPSYYDHLRADYQVPSLLNPLPSPPGLVGLSLPLPSPPWLVGLPRALIVGSCLTRVLRAVIAGVLNEPRAARQAKRDLLAEALEAGGIIPMKGEGGFFLIGDTRNLKVRCSLAPGRAQRAFRGAHMTWQN